MHARSPRVVCIGKGGSLVRQIPVVLSPMVAGILVVDTDRRTYQKCLAIAYSS